MKDKYCKICEEKGVKSKLKVYSVNFDEGILLCENDMCVYPFGVDNVETCLLRTTSRAASDNQPERKAKVKRTDQSSTIQENLSTKNLATEFYWSNSDKLCWLDSVMTLLVNNRCLQLCLRKYQPNNSVLQELYSDFNKAQKYGPNQRGKEALCNARMKVFEFLKRKMQCSLGVNDSALESLNALLKDNSVICDRFSQDCEWTFKCSSCGYTQVDRHKKLVVSFPNTMDDFSMSSGVFLRSCYKCKTPGQRSQLDLKRLPPCVIAHFVEGVRNKDFFQSDFVSQGNSYQLCQVIQYKKNPDHFVAWIRNENGTHWAEVDDTQSIVCRWEKGVPSFPLDEVHIAVWERAKLFQRKCLPVETGAKVAGKPSEVLSCNVKSTTSKLVPSEDGRIRETSVTRNGCLSESFANSHLNKVKGSNGKMEFNTNSITDTRKSVEVKANSAVEKRKNTFEPYIPKKKRSVSSALSKDEVKIVPGFEDVPFPSHVKVEKDKLGASSCDNQSDSGYSSPGSNSSCVSLPSNACTKADHSIINEIVDTLDELVFPTNERLETNLQELDSCGMKSTALGESGKGDLPESSGHCNSSCIQNNACGVTTSSKLPVSGEFSLQNMLNVDESLDRTLESQSDFADIDTMSNCGTDFMDDIDSLEFLETMDAGLSAGGTKEDSVDTSRNLLEKEKQLGSDSVASSENNSDLTSDDCVLQPLKLPDIADYVKLELEIHKSAELSYNCEDILEEIFPSQLL